MLSFFFLVALWLRYEVEIREKQKKTVKPILGPAFPGTPVFMGFYALFMGF
jgi:hypothetical protein